MTQSGTEQDHLEGKLRALAGPGVHSFLWWQILEGSLLSGCSDPWGALGDRSGVHPGPLPQAVLLRETTTLRPRATSLPGPVGLPSSILAAALLPRSPSLSPLPDHHPHLCSSLSPWLPWGDAGSEATMGQLGSKVGGRRASIQVVYPLQLYTHLVSREVMGTLPPVATEGPPADTK